MPQQCPPSLSFILLLLAATPSSFGASLLKNKLNQKQPLPHIQTQRLAEKSLAKSPSQKKKKKVKRKKKRAPEEVSRSFLVDIGESVQYSFQVAWEVTQQTILALGFTGWLQEFLIGMGQYGLILLLYHGFLNDKVQLGEKIKKVASDLFAGQLSGLESIGHFIANYWSYFFEFALTSMLFGLSLNWVKCYIEALLGKTSEKEGNRLRISTVTLRTFLLWLLTYDPLQSLTALQQQFKKNSFLEAYGNALCYLFVTLAIFIAAEFLIEKNEENKKEEGKKDGQKKEKKKKKDPQGKTILQALTKGMIATTFVVAWAQIVKKDIINFTKINAFLHDKTGISIFNPEKNIIFKGKALEACQKQNQKLQLSHGLGKELALFGLFHASGCLEYTQEFPAPGDRLVSSGIDDGYLRIMPLWEMLALYREKVRRRTLSAPENAHTPLRTERIKGSLMQRWDALVALFSQLKGYYEALLYQDLRILLQGIVVNALLEWQIHLNWRQILH